MYDFHSFYWMKSREKWGIYFCRCSRVCFALHIARYLIVVVACRMFGKQNSNNDHQTMNDNIMEMDGQFVRNENFDNNLFGISFMRSIWRRTQKQREFSICVRKREEPLSIGRGLDLRALHRISRKWCCIAFNCKRGHSIQIRMLSPVCAARMSVCVASLAYTMFFETIYNRLGNSVQIVGGNFSAHFTIFSQTNWFNNKQKRRLCGCRSARHDFSLLFAYWPIHCSLCIVALDFLVNLPNTRNQWSIVVDVRAPAAA